MIHVVASADEDLPEVHARAASVTLLIGERHALAWRRLCAGSWMAYAERCGLDVILIVDRLDAEDDGRSPVWQKLLILNRPWSQRYERIVWLDSDIIIANAAPDILQHAGPLDKVSLCIDAGRLSGAEGQLYVERTLDVRLRPSAFETSWGKVQREYYERAELPQRDIMFNSGVMVLSPERHKAALLDAYRGRELIGLSEQANLSDRLLSADLAHVLSPRFNWGLIEAIQFFVNSGLRGGEDEKFIGEVTHMLLRCELRKAYFLHFYGAMRLLETYANLPAFESLARAEAA